MYFDTWIWNGKETLQECLGSFVSYKLGLIMGVCALQVAVVHTYLGVSSPSKSRDSLFHNHLLISSPLWFSFLFLTPFFHTFIYVWLSSSSYASFHIFYFCTFIIIITILVFFIYPLQVHLHTYLSTWLSLCPVEILFGLIPIIDNLKTHKE